jgi:hypothetical protein
MAERFDDRSGNLFENTPRLALRAAFLDALIGNQDRSRSNLLFDPSRDDLALIDHGFAFRRGDDVVHRSYLVDWRRRGNLMELMPEERDAVDTLLADDGLLGLRRYLEPERAESLAERAYDMRDTGRLA